MYERATRLLLRSPSDLEAWRKACGNPPESAPVIPNGRGEPWADYDWDNWREPHLPRRRRGRRPARRDDDGAERVRPRDLRSSFATLLIYEGQPPQYVAEQLGHSAATLLRDYARVWEDFDPSQRDQRRGADRPSAQTRARVSPLLSDTGAPSSCTLSALDPGRSWNTRRRPCSIGVPWLFLAESSMTKKSLQIHRKPSDGLEPSTPSLPWKGEGVTSVHVRSRSGTKCLQPAPKVECTAVVGETRPKWNWWTENGRTPVCECVADFQG